MAAGTPGISRDYLRSVFFTREFHVLFTRGMRAQTIQRAVTAIKAIAVSRNHFQRPVCQHLICSILHLPRNVGFQVRDYHRGTARLCRDTHGDGHFDAFHEQRRSLGADAQMCQDQGLSMHRCVRCSPNVLGKAGASLQQRLRPGSFLSGRGRCAGLASQRLGTHGHQTGQYHVELRQKPVAPRLQ